MQIIHVTLPVAEEFEAEPAMPRTASLYELAGFLIDPPWDSI
jgi:hypothetical protein